MSKGLLEVDIVWQQGGRPARAQFHLRHGITALIGPSGSGKTTLARMIAGLERPNGGTIRFQEHILYHGIKKRFVSAAQRGIGLVMQEAGLFPHMTVEKNICFGAASTPESVAEAMEVMGVRTLLDRNPSSLSGGESRRVAMARALAAQPDMLILDEPMTGLDPKSRAEILPYIKGLSRATGTPVLFITHHLDDMLAVADHAVLMAPRQVIASGPLEKIVSAPECADLLGLSDAGQLVSATVNSRENGLLKADAAGTTLLLPDGEEPVGSRITLRIFASDISLAREKVPKISVLNQLPATIDAIRETETHAIVELCLEGSRNILCSKVTRHTVSRMGLEIGDRIFALVKAVSVKDVVHAPDT